MWSSFHLTFGPPSIMLHPPLPTEARYPQALRRRTHRRQQQSQSEKGSDTASTAHPSLFQIQTRQDSGSHPTPDIQSCWHCSHDFHPGTHVLYPRTQEPAEGNLQSLPTASEILCSATHSTNGSTHSTNGSTPSLQDYSYSTLRSHWYRLCWSSVILKKGHTRKPVLEKGYVVVVVCLTTKCVHLDI